MQLARLARRGAAALGVLAGGAAVARAQSAALQAVAQVRPALTVLALRDLDFGSVLPGVPKTIAVSGSASGRFRVDGEANAQITLTFTLPSDLASGSDLLPIGAWTGYHNNAPNTSSGTSFTPSGAPTAAQLSPAGRQFVWVGATVTPAPVQASGTYGATIVLTVDYL